MNSCDKHVRSLAGCLIGQAVGDALGLPCEQLSQNRQKRLFPSLDRMHFLPGRGMFSDDTEHACLTAQALIRSGGDPAKFAQALAWRLRGWVLGLPAGTGLASLKACCRLWLGFSPDRSGVFSAGNGPAMRSAIIGAAYAGNEQKLKELVKCSTRMTHTDPKAEQGALVVALAAAWSAKGDFAQGWPTRFLAHVDECLGIDAAELKGLLNDVWASVERGEDLRAFLDKAGHKHGVSGYMFHTVPAVIHVWWRKPLDYPYAIKEIIRAGGDADTTAAILGGIIGVTVGKEGVPVVWRNGLYEWPRTLGWMERLAAKLAETVATGREDQAVPYFWPGIIPRNALFALVVILHGFRRMLPPY